MGFTKNIAIIIIVVATTMGILFGIGISYQNNENSVNQKPIKTISLDEKIRDITYDDVSIYNTQTEYGKTLVITIPAHFTLFNTNDWVQKVNMDMMSIFTLVFTNSEYNDVSLVVVIANEEFVDNFGETKEEAGFAVSLSRDTASKIKNWGQVRLISHDNPFKYYNSIIDTSNGDEVYMHPAILRDF